MFFGRKPILHVQKLAFRDTDVVLLYRQQKNKSKMIKYIILNRKNPKDKTKSASACSSHPAPPWRPPSKSSTTPTSNSSSLKWRERKPTVETRRAKKCRDAACRVSPAKINRQWGKYKFSGNAFANFLFFLVSFPSDTGHAPSLHFWRARLYKNTFLGCLQAAKPFCKP